MSKSQTRSEFYNSYLGETKNKFDHTRHRKNNSIAEQSFFQWTSSNMYRTSYNDMTNRVRNMIQATNHFNAKKIFRSIQLPENKLLEIPSVDRLLRVAMSTFITK